MKDDFATIDACQRIMLTAADLAGFNTRDIAAACAMTYCLIMATTAISEAEFAETCIAAFRLSKEMLLRKAAAPIDPTSLAEREPQGGVS